MPEPSLDSWTVIFLLAAAQGIFLSLVFLLKRNDRPAILINVLVLLFSITLLNYIAFWTNYRFVFPHISRISIAFPFLFGPIFYLYIASYLKKRAISIRDIWQFLPFLLYTLLQLPFYLLSSEEKISIFLNGQFLPFSDVLSQEALMSIYRTSNVLMIIHLIIYCGLSFKLISQTELKNASAEIKQYLAIIKYSFLGFVLSFTSYYVMVYAFSYVRVYDYAISVAMSLFIYGIGYFSLVSPKVFTDDFEDHILKEKYSNSGLNEKEAKVIKEKLIQLMEFKKLYLDSDLKLNDLAEAANVSKHHVSQVINNQLNTTFSAFVNDYRIKESQKLLEDKSQELNMFGIAKESGFNNKTTFSLAFKRHTGLSPSNYKEKVLRQQN